MKKILLFTITLILYSCSNDDDAQITNIAFERSEYAIKIGESLSLKVIHTPESLPAHNYVWLSSTPDVVSVEKGTIKGESIGESTIKVVSSENQNLSTSCLVKVLPIDVSGIKIADVPNLKVGEETIVSYTILPENATYKDVIWSVDNPSIVAIDDDGRLKGIAIGKTKVVVKVKDTNIADACIVEVIPTPVTGVECEDEIKVLIGESEKVNASVQPENATNKTAIWSSRNINIATVDKNGAVFGVAKGNTTVEIKTEEGEFKDICSVAVCEIDEFVTASTFVGTEGSTSSGFYSYLRLNFDTNTNQKVNIDRIILTDESGVVKGVEANIGSVKSYSVKFITQMQNDFNTFPAKGWKVTVEYVWNNRSYNKTVINKGLY